MIRFGLVGCGRIADRHLASLASCTGAELVAVCDIQVERMDDAEAFYRDRVGKKSEAGNSTMAKYTDIQQLLQDERVQAVVISTHSALHAQFAKQALEAGKHVLVEKPLALSTEDADEIVQLATERGLHVQVCHQLRYRPLMRRIKQLVENGALGKLYMGTVSMRLQRSLQYYTEARWRGTWDQDGGMLLNQGIHLVDLLQWLIGEEAVQVYGQLAKTDLPKQTEDVAAGIIRFRGGALGVIEANTITQPNNLDNSLTLFGDKGTISIGGVKLNEIRRWHSADGSDPPEASELQADEHLMMLEAFVDRLEGEGGSLYINAAEGSKALGIVFGLYDSFRHGRTAQLPLDTFTTNMMTKLEGWS